MVEESNDERRHRLSRAAARRRRIALPPAATAEARMEAVHEAWKRIYAGGEFPIHFDVIVSNGGYSQTERCTLLDTVFTTDVFDDTKMVGCHDSIKLLCRRSKDVPPNFIHHAKLG